MTPAPGDEKSLTAEERATWIVDELEIHIGVHRRFSWTERLTRDIKAAEAVARREGYIEGVEEEGGNCDDHCQKARKEAFEECRLILFEQVPQYMAPFDYVHTRIEALQRGEKA